MSTIRKRVVAFVPTPLIESSPNGFAPRWRHFLMALAELHDLEIVFVRGLWHWFGSGDAVLPPEFPAAKVSIVDVQPRRKGSGAGGSFVGNLKGKLRILRKAHPDFIPECDLNEVRARAGDAPDLVVCFLFQTIQFADIFPGGTRCLAVLEEWPGPIPIDVPVDVIRARNGIWRYVFWSAQRSKMIKFFRDAAARGQVLLINEHEVQKVGRFVPPEKLSIISHGVDCAYFSADASDPKANQDFDIAVVGVMSEPRNYAPALKFYELVQRMAGARELRWAFVGSDPSDALLRLRSNTVFVSGTVPDVRPFYARSRIIAVPLESQAGTKSSVLQGWAMRRPVVTTKEGASGIPAATRRNLLIAQSLDDLAQKTLALLADPGHQASLAEAGYRTAREQFDYRLLSRKFVELCNKLMRVSMEAPE